jgi:hypothetical protein
MNKKKISLTLAFVSSVIISGCASIQQTNLANLGNEHYREKIVKSKTTQEIKEYAISNNIKFILIHTSSNANTNSFVINGATQNLITLEGNKWLGSIMDELVITELATVRANSVTPNVYTLTYCGDFTHMSMGENGSSGKMEFSYYLSNLSDEQRGSFLVPRTYSDCAISGFLGDVFYKNKVEVSSSPSNAKISVAPIDKSKPITGLDNVSLVLKDMASQAMTAMLSDAEMLQALKDYRLTGGKKIPVEQPSKATVTEPIITPPSTNQSVNLDSFKIQCKELGFKVGTADYGNCVLQLMK